MRIRRVKQQKQLEAQEEAFTVIQDEHLKLKETMKQITARMKEWREESKKLKEAYAPLKLLMKKTKIAVAAERKTIMK